MKEKKKCTIFFDLMEGELMGKFCGNDTDIELLRKCFLDKHQILTEDMKLYAKK